MVEPSPKPRGRTITSLTAVLGVLLTVRAVASVVSPAGMTWDYRQYYLAGNRAAEGRVHELYLMPRSVMESWKRDLGIKVRNNEDTTTGADSVGLPDELIGSGRLGYIGFPLTAYAWAPVGALPPRAGLLVFKLGCALSLALALYLLFPAFRDSARVGPRALPLFLGVVLLYEPFWFSFSAGGQATPVVFLLLVLFYRLLVQDRIGWASVCLAVAILIKPFFIVLLPILFLGREIRTVLCASIGLGVLVGLSVLLFGFQLHLEWWEIMRISATGVAEPWWNNVAILGSVYTWWTHTVGAPLDLIGTPDSPWVHYVMTVFKLVVILLLFYRAATLRRVESDSAQARHALVGLGVLLGLFFSNIVWPHYLTFLFLPLMFWLVPRTPLPRTAAALAWLTLISTMSVHSRFAQRWALSLLDGMPLVQTLTAMFFGSVTLILVFILFAAFYNPLRKTTQGVPLFNLLPPASQAPAQPTPR